MSVPGTDRLSIAGRVLGLATSATLHPLLRRGNAAPSTRRVLELLGLAIGQSARGTAVERIRLGGVDVDLVTPAVPPTASIVYFHGGAYVSGSTRSYRRLLTHLAAATGCRVYAVDYRLAPEHPFPAALDDGIEACTAVADRHPAAPMVIAGDSAGGGLTLAAAVALRDRSAALPAALVCIAPWVDLTCSGSSMRSHARRERMMTPAGLRADARRYAGDADPRDPAISPLFADLRGLAPLLIQVGDDEVLLDDALRLAEVARDSGVEVALQIWPRLWHVWHLYAGVMPEADAAVTAIADFIAGQLRPAIGPSV